MTVAGAQDRTSVLSVENLSIALPEGGDRPFAVEQVSFAIKRNEVVCLVGESGSGKSMIAHAILSLLPKGVDIVSGAVKVAGQDTAALDRRALRRLRGGRAAMIFQEPLSSLNPLKRVGEQIEETILTHQRPAPSAADIKARVQELLTQVGLPNPPQLANSYPFELSGGQRQRVMIAMAMSNQPALLIADEPTTALDVTIQAQVLDVLERIQDRTESSVMLITHDLGVVAGVADRVLVMYGGRQVERGTVDQIFYEPRHPYAEGLLASLPRLDRRSDKTNRLHRILGQPPSLIFLPPGCAFHPRCPIAEVPGRCDTERPELRLVGPDHWSACHFAERLAEDPEVALGAPEATP